MTPIVTAPTKICRPSRCFFGMCEVGSCWKGVSFYQRYQIQYDCKTVLITLGVCSVGVLIVAPIVAPVIPPPITCQFWCHWELVFFEFRPRSEDCSEPC